MILKLDCRIYNKQAIVIAAENFKEICQVEIKNDDFEIELIPKTNDKNIDSEFCNHVLAQMI